MAGWYKTFSKEYSSVKTDSNIVAVSAVFLVIGAAAGGALTFEYMQSEINSLNERLDDLESSANVVRLNYTENTGLSTLFQSVDQSAVYVRAYGADNSQGSGFIYSEDGYIVTNAHVVQDADRVEVGFLDGSTRRARIIGTDPYTDLAVLKVSKSGLEPLELADSSEVQVGQKAVAIGNPFGLRSSMTSGIISQKGRSLRTQGGFSTPNVLQTDAAINPGNSGGPLMNLRGEVVGVNTAIESSTGTFSGVGFAIPSNTVKNVVPSLIEDQDHQHPWIGVSGVDVSPEIADRMDLENTTGFLVVDVVEDSPADQAGIRPGNRTENINGNPVNLGGDVITAINGEKMRGINDILLYLSRETEVDQEVNVTVIREGERVDIPLTLGARSDQ
ncbi:MAG: S1-C subfamily serine protease [Candidatus Nanohaloarchaea archaeon]